MTNSRRSQMDGAKRSNAADFPDIWNILSRYA
eukprot:CAMPEP_0184478322 /NCGR_PEP_ID=MMETSP0113_2-20130426/380_1 /TAXON_ID=91329 /ORGANISM="Norrisiella sphaerica, Strain BC52" /LENGTH=31 /DNA_ID= /DNA_START= /DNA_END= /DNA_ORIENTATION=